MTSMYADCFRGKPLHMHEVATKGVVGENLKCTVIAMMVFVLQQCTGKTQQGMTTSVVRPMFQVSSLSWDSVHISLSLPDLP